jgi:hypothetical protein
MKWVPEEASATTGTPCHSLAETGQQVGESLPRRAAIWPAALHLLVPIADN